MRNWWRCSTSRSRLGRRRKARTAFVDLHCHSTASDGECLPAEVVRRAHAAGLAAIALTDHDTTAGVSEAAAAGEQLGVRVVSGCEFSVKAPWGELHLLGYFLPPGDERLQAFLAGTRAARQRRGELMVVRLRALGLDIEMSDVSAQAGEGALGRPHVARALVERRITGDIGEAFTRFLGRGKPAFVEKPLPTLGEVTALVRAVGGVTVAAHLGARGTEGQLRVFRDEGLDGLEVRHPSHSAATETRLMKLADRLGMAMSGGSDWHGDTLLGETHAELGEMDVPLEWLTNLEQRRVEGVET